MSIVMTCLGLISACVLSDVLVNFLLLGTSSVQTDPNIILDPFCVRQHDPLAIIVD